MDQMYEELNEAFVTLYNDFINIEKTALLSSRFTDISINDVHIIEAVGMGEDRNMSTIAHKLSVTVGSLTTAMNGLVRKGYVQRERSELDRRVVYIRLTDKGQAVYERHTQFHMKVVKALTEHATEDDLKLVLHSLNQATEIIENL